jgi:hypothetical protein
MLKQIVYLLAKDFRSLRMPADPVEIRVGSGGDKVRLLSLHDLDRRTAAYKRTMDLIEQIEADAGGHDRLSTGERQIIQRAAVTAALAEHLETQWLSGEEIDPGLYCTLGNALRRLLETVGLRRVPRDVSPLDDEGLRAYREEFAS